MHHSFAESSRLSRASSQPDFSLHAFVIHSYCPSGQNQPKVLRNHVSDQRGQQGLYEVKSSNQWLDRLNSSSGFTLSGPPSP